MIELLAPERIVVGQPIDFSFRSDHRVSGRLRLTSGEEALTFTLERPGKDPVTDNNPRVRGKEGGGRITEWGKPLPGTELVLRFEGAKAWMLVVGPEETGD